MYANMTSLHPFRNLSQSLHEQGDEIKCVHGTPTHLVCVCVAGNSNRPTRDGECKRKKIWKVWIRVHTASNNDESVIIFVMLTTGRIAHHTHAVRTIVCAVCSVVGNKISQCAESLCNMSSWHHENAKPNGEHKIVGSQTTLWRSMWSTPIALREWSASPTLLRLRILVSGLACQQVTRSADHITRLILFEVCVYSCPICEHDPMRDYICCCDFIYLFIKMFVVRSLSYSLNMRTNAVTRIAQLIKVITNKFVRRRCFTQRTAEAQRRRVNCNLSSWIIIFYIQEEFHMHFRQSGACYQFLATKTQNWFCATHSTNKQTWNECTRTHSLSRAEPSHATDNLSVLLMGVDSKR